MMSLLMTNSTWIRENMPEFSTAVLPPLSVISHRLHTVSLCMQNTVLIIQTL